MLERIEGVSCCLCHLSLNVVMSTAANRHPSIHQYGTAHTAGAGHVVLPLSSPVGHDTGQIVYLDGWRMDGGWMEDGWRMNGGWMEDE